MDEVALLLENILYYICTVFKLMYYLLLLLLVCADIEINPGPINNNFHIFHSNVQSLNKEKIEYICDNIVSDYEIICLTETN